MITSEQLEVMSQQNIERLNTNDLVDINTIHIEKDLSHSEKVLSFLEKIKNPYCFLCGEVPVKVCFSNNTSELGEVLQNFFIHIKQS